jgi:hypothetical protein
MKRKSKQFFDAKNAEQNCLNKLYTQVHNVHQFLYKNQSGFRLITCKIKLNSTALSVK